MPDLPRIWTLEADDLSETWKGPELRNGEVVKVVSVDPVEQLLERLIEALEVAPEADLGPEPGREAVEDEAQAFLVAFRSDSKGKQS